ncbi:uncharacterized protein EV422DRAFT_564089 [Fimicolochytrium jonesii]|uniref:uncharacterized protein n=1 Tax=Fimicolochytrium jonesii TaxID=1396493 RepID=UPI0022FE36DC|nr:uncharacterized protein EV422DRAFT_564089 [Fimicolochytrium jonesii]KAI8826286.1 hypothetical protein EV422DRAFT_564089 [Fimicolochytrium jonesii]
MEMAPETYKDAARKLGMRKGDARYQTHFNLPGRGLFAKLSVPSGHVRSDLYDKLFQVMQQAGDHIRSSPCVLCERVPQDGLFRLFFDWDVQVSEVGTDEEVLQSNRQVVQGIRAEVIASYGVGFAGTCLLISQGCMQKIHVNCPDITVTKDIARSFCERLRKRLLEKGCLKAGMEKEWLDTSVYNGQGLRLLGCHKGDCLDLGDVEKYEMRFGKGTFRYAYEPVDSATFVRRRICREDLDDYSIIPEPVPSVTPLCPAAKAALGLATKRTTGTSDVTRTSGKFRNTAELADAAGSVANSSGDHVTDDGLKQWLATEFSLSDGNNVCIDQSRRIPGPGKRKGEGKRVEENVGVIIPTRDRACPFKRGQHKANHVYFLLHRTSLEIRCHDEGCGTRSSRITYDTIPQPICESLDALRSRVLKSSTDGGLAWKADKRSGADLIGKELASLRIEYPQNQFDFDEDQAAVHESGAWLMLRDLYCIKCKKHHEDPQNFLECSTTGKIVLHCLRTLFTPGHPLLTVPSSVTNVLFQGNNNVINVNCATDDGKGDIRDFGRMADFPRSHDNERLDQLCFESLTMGRTDDIAAYVEEAIKGKYAFIDENWYRFTGSYWNKGVTPRAFLTREVSRTYASLRDSYNDRKQIRWLNMIVEDLGNSNRRKYVMADLEQRLRESTEPPVPIDSNPCLLGFQNGVFDSRDGSFREHRQEDYLSYLLPHSIPGRSDPVLRAEILRFFQQIMPNQGVRKFLLLTLALSLEGKNSHQIATIWTGCGGNGKSQLKSFIKMVFTHLLFAEPMVTFLTNEVPDAQRPAPHLVDLATKRALFCSELEAGKKANGAFIKVLSGNDHISARDCNSNKIVSFLPRFIPTLLCNDIPKMSGGGTDLNALWRRLKIILFEVKFVKSPRPECPQEMLVDFDLGAKMERWPGEFLLLLMEVYREHIATGRQLTEPAEVSANLEEQKTENNPFPSWFHSAFEPSAEAEIHAHRVANLFEQHLHRENNDEKLRGPSTKETTKQLKGWTLKRTE